MDAVLEVYAAALIGGVTVGMLFVFLTLFYHGGK